MCNLVKDYASKLQGKLSEGEQVREELGAVKEKQMEEMQVHYYNFLVILGIKICVFVLLVLAYFCIRTTPHQDNSPPYMYWS